MRHDKKSSRDGKALRFLPTFNFTTSAGVVAMLLTQAMTLSLPALLADPGEPLNARTASRRPSRIQRHTGAGGRGMHRAWKHQRASGRA